ncbi:hypothetical protein BU17DRAFT_79451 [Hysterangium stoloniferum]|nr:hypothetical protein BU17DRAFT_79451 [Hysterangium stoloniferum]
MPLEATMMIIDNSEYMRNGDYAPTRFEAQSDAVTTVFGSKIDSNPENTVGVMTSGGKGPEVLVTHTKDLGQILQGLHSSAQRISGSPDIPTSLSVAQLALKHRQNKNLRQRIILFVGSPVGTDERTLVRIAKKLKKNNVAVDVVLFGDEETRGTNEPALKTFVDTVGSGDNSHIVIVPPGTLILSDMIVSSPILSGDFPNVAGDGADAAGPGAGEASGSGGANYEFGVDPSLDPELAMALRMSLEEERARQAVSAPPAAAAPSSAAPTTLPPVPEASSTHADEEDEEAMLAQALAMSQDTEGADADGDVEMGEEEMSEEEAIAKAIAMSMQEGDDEDEAAKRK